jgi:rod shape-determining protein MreD
VSEANLRCRPMVIPISFLVAFLLTLMPLPDWAIHFRPAWIALVLIYWVMALPQRVGLFTAWTLGLLLDVSQGALLGQHALGLTVLAFIVIKFYQRIRVFPLWQQAVSVGIILTIYLTLVYWIYGISGQPPGSWLYWLPILSSSLLWPWVFVLLRDLRRRCKLS